MKLGYLTISWTLVGGCKMSYNKLSSTFALMKLLIPICSL